MPSTIDGNIPRVGTPIAAQEIRDNFRAARTDIIVLEVAIGAEVLRATNRENEIEALIPVVLADLSDVSAAAPADGQALLFDGGAGQWTPGVPGTRVNAQVGTSYTMVQADAGRLVTFSNAAAIAVTLPQAGAGGEFTNGWSTTVLGLGAGTVTITPAVSTINGAASITVLAGMGGGRLVSDGTNYLWTPTPSFYYSANGALSNQMPLQPNATISGDARGSNAIDFQTGRNNGNQVASGASSVAFGYRVRASGVSAAGVGSIATASGSQSSAFGSSATASGERAVAVGYNIQSTGDGAVSIGSGNQAQGDYSISIGAGALVSAFAHRSLAFGQASVWSNGTDNIVFASNSLTAFGKNNVMLAPQRGDDRANVSMFVWSPQNLGGSTINTGRSQVEHHMFIGSTSGATALRLTTDGNAAGAANVAALATSQALFFSVEILLANTVSGASWTFTLGPSLLRKDASNATTALYANGGGVVAGPTTAGPPALGAAPTVAADTTNGGLNISFTPPIGNTSLYYAVAIVKGHSTRWN